MPPQDPIDRYTRVPTNQNKTTAGAWWFAYLRNRLIWGSEHNPHTKSINTLRCQQSEYAKIRFGIGWKENGLSPTGHSPPCGGATNIARKRNCSAAVQSVWFCSLMTGTCQALGIRCVRNAKRRQNHKTEAEAAIPLLCSVDCVFMLANPTPHTNEHSGFL